MSKVTEEIKSKLEVVSLIGEYVQLKPAGTNYKGRCPFHNERTPSFMVSRERQFWHCFGCNIGGDIFEFLMKIENLEFVEVLKILADKTGVKLTDDVRIETYKNEKNRLLDIMRLAAKFYHKILLDSSQSSDARSYLLEDRKLTPFAIDEWQIGFIPDTWDLLTQFLLKKGISVQDISHAGLSLQKQGGGLYDRFRGRIMFPLFDVQGNIVGFTGRLLKEDPSFQQGKYVNTPQTPLYDKSKILYGLNYAKQSIKEKGFAIIVEGQMDVIACHQYGMRNVVASSGTALSADQVRILKRFTSQLYLAFDADAAGQLAARRGMDIALTEGIQVKIITIPEGVAKDPDECLKKAPEVWEKSVAGAKHLMEYYFDLFTKGINLNESTARTKVAKGLIGEILKLIDPVEREFWMNRLAGLLGISLSVLKEQQLVEVAQKKPKFLDQRALKSSKETIIEQEEPIHKISRQILAWCLKSPSLWTEVFPSLRIDGLQPLALQNIFTETERLMAQAKSSNASIEEINTSLLKNSTSKDEQQEILLAELLGQALLEDLPEDSGDIVEESTRTVKELVTRINVWYTVKKRQELARIMEEAERLGDKESIQLVSEELNKLLLK